MKQVDLPLIAISTGLGTVLTQLRKSKRSALLSESESDLKSTAKLKPKPAPPRVAVQVKKAQPGEGRSAQRPGLGRAKAANILGRSTARYALGTIAT